MPGSADRAGLAAAIRRTVPERPGAYLFRDARGEVVYVGKAVDLRRRMLSYFRPARASLDPRTRQMVFSIHDFEFHETESELLALLLEDVLIKREKPRHNIRQLEFDENKYLVITDDPYPACRVVDRSEQAAGSVFGPFRDRYLAAEIVDILGRHFGLRSCHDPEPFRRSARYDLGLCSGPCRGAVSVDDYSLIVSRVRDFLNGDESWIAEKLQGDMTRSAARLDFEQAAEFRRLLDFCRRFSSRQRFIRRFRTGKVQVSDDRFCYLFRVGGLRKVVNRDRSGAANVPEGLRAAPVDERWLLDRAHVLFGWLARNRDVRTGQ